MRIAVVGATGNAGTAVLRALKETSQVKSIVGIARRLPDTTSEPYAGCDWVQIDIAAASTQQDAHEKLAAAFQGVDAVIHLSWLIQPNLKRELLRRVNVEGTQRVADAVAAAGVPHLVVASSVGVYSPDRSSEPREESWSTGGIGSSHYSVDKAAQERVLDDFAARHPGIVVTRLRPALIFQAEAASQIQRYFLAGWVPVQLLRAGRPPVLPLPRGIRIQAVHADDVARAYVRAVLTRAPGAFNICADDVLGPQELADVVDHGRYVELPPALFRTGVFVGHKLRILAADEGWLDLGMLVPVMDNSRAKAELGWEPRHSAAEAVHHLLRGLGEGKGADSVPMRQRDADAPDAGATHLGGSIPASAAIGSKIDGELLSLYLSDHLTAAVAGSERIGRMADDFVDTPVYGQLSALADDIRSERAFLGDLIDALGTRRRPHRQAASWVMERLGRLKGNKRVVSRSPMTIVVETELMRSAALGRLGLWQTLEELAGELGLERATFSHLASRAHGQVEVLGEVHAWARARAFRTDRPTFGTDTTDP